MPLSKTSRQKLNTCHSDLIKLIEAVAETEKCAVICGFRGRHEQEKWMESFKNTDRNIKLMVELENGKTIGMVMLTGIDWKNRVALLEYKISAPVEYRIKGDIYDAAEGMLSYAFNELGLNCVTATVMLENKFSLKLVKKLGFVQEGVMRQRVYKNGEFKDQAEFSLLRDEYYSLRNKDNA